MPSMRAKAKSLEDVSGALRDAICGGDLPAGEKINEIALSKTLGTSRTPLREALRTLEAEGLIASERNRGFWIAPLTSQEVRDLYPIVWSLEGLAMRESSALLPTTVRRLKEINAALAKKGRDPATAEALDREFHAELTRHCANNRLIAMIEQLKRRLGRYERLYMVDASLIPLSVSQHDQIIKGIEGNDIEEAVISLESNWKFGMKALLRKIP